MKPKPLNQAKEEFIRRYLADVLTKTKGCTSEAARIAGWSVPNFCQLLRRHAMKAEDYRQ
jgi:DNA-binding NtrC family response regulator